MGKSEGIRNDQGKDRKGPAKPDSDGNVLWVGDGESPLQTLRRLRGRGAENGTPRVGAGKRTAAGREQIRGPSHSWRMEQGLSEAVKGPKCSREEREGVRKAQRQQTSGAPTG